MKTNYIYLGLICALFITSVVECRLKKSKSQSDGSNKKIMVVDADKAAGGGDSTNATSTTKGNKALEKVRDGTTAMNMITEIFVGKKAKRSVFLRKLVMMSGGFAPMFGIVGGVMTLVTMFMPGGPNKQLDYMKSQFAKVDAKFGQVFKKFEDQQNMIMSLGIKNEYHEYEIKILALSDLLNKFLNSTPEVAKVYKIKFLNRYMKGPKGAATKLFQGMTGKGDLSSNIPETVMKHTNYHRSKVLDILMGIFHVLVQGSKVEIAYQKFKHDSDETYWKTVASDWTERMKIMTDLIAKVDKRLVEVWEIRSTTDIKHNLAESHGKSNRYIVDSLHRFLSEKYDWRIWHVVAFNDTIYNGDDFILMNCIGNRFIFKNLYSKHVLVSSVDEETDPGCKASPLDLFKTTETRYKDTSKKWSDINYSAKNIYLRMDKRLKDCDSVIDVGVVKNQKADIQHTGPGDRIAVVNNEQYQLFAFV